ncbi:uncharacterized protein [Amphiura filiformis]|uniref:uncharacterized protein n=1 Tax=Amphiura filiformis TaxID=82378 RepID=UPI003B211C82
MSMATSSRMKLHDFRDGLLNAKDPEETIDFTVCIHAEELTINMEPPDREIINIIRNSYRDTTCAVKAEGSLSSWFKIITGVRQGDIWSPLLFGLAIDFILKRAVDENNRGLILMPRRSSRYPEENADGSNTKELNNRIGRATGAFRELDKVWKDRNINLETKLKFYNACVLSTLLYAAECWTLTERDEARLDAFDMQCQHKILRVIWSQHIPNSHIRSKTKQPQLTSVIWKRRLQWFGYLQRMDKDRIPKRLYL